MSVSEVSLRHFCVFPLLTLRSDEASADLKHRNRNDAGNTNEEEEEESNKHTNTEKKKKKQTNFSHLVSSSSHKLIKYLKKKSKI